MATYTNISLDEMTSFLTDPNFPGGPFTRVYPEGYTEAAFARRVPNDKLQLSLRVNSGIVGEDSRDVGKDAIRVSLYWRQQAGDRPRPVMGSRRVHRVAGWKKNLLDRINNFGTPKQCPCCGLPMVVRKGKTGNFLGCICWNKDKSGCNHTENAPEGMDAT